MKRSNIKHLFVALGLFVSTGLLGTDWQAYSAELLKTAQSSGQSVVLDFHADWCGTCQKQKPILEKILHEAKYSSIVGLTVNYDEASELKKALNVVKQSTLIVFKGNVEVGRSTGSINPDAIRELFDKGL